jgi:hypothetical protein
MVSTFLEYWCKGKKTHSDESLAASLFPVTVF